MKLGCCLGENLMDTPGAVTCVVLALMQECWGCG